jgi:hypothetical protein
MRRNDGAVGREEEAELHRSAFFFSDVFVAMVYYVTN